MNMPKFDLRLNVDSKMALLYFFSKMNFLYRIFFKF